MIQELVNYSEWLKKDFPDLFEGIVFEGIHIQIELDGDGKLTENGFKFEVYRKGNIPSSFLLGLTKRENIGEMIPIYIIKNKYIDPINKFFSSNNYYSYFFKLFQENKKDLKLSEAFDFKPRKLVLKDNEYRRKFQLFIKNYEKTFKQKLEKHYKCLKNRNIKNSIIPKGIDDNFEIEKDFDHIKNYLENRFWDTFFEKDIVSHFITNGKNDSKEISKENKALLTNTIFLTFKTPYIKNNLERQTNFYYKKRLSLKESKNDYEKCHTITGEWPYIFNPILTQDNERKIFSRHQSHFTLINKKLHSENIIAAMNLLKLLYNGMLPNPIPIFLDNDELNKKVISIYKRGNIKKYTQIIKSLIKDHGEDLQNYYIISYSKGQSLIINDVDLISSFNFWINIEWNHKLFEIFDIKIPYAKVEHIFHLEKKFRNTIFNINKLKYFDDIDFPQEIPNFQKNNIYKYRKLLYDAFYKSNLHLITTKIFKDICLATIRYEISHDDSNHRKNDNLIVEKLMIYIHFYKLFDTKKGEIDMPSKLPQYYNNLLSLLRGEIDHYQSAEDFAFGTGQLIRYLLKQSESSNTNHSMFTPFLQKLGNYNVFIMQINRALRTYGHKIEMNDDIFDKIMSNSTGYQLDSDKSLKELETTLICGYFAKPAIDQIIKERNIKGDKDDNQRAI